jgi:hypothetical protein
MILTYKHWRAGKTIREVTAVRGLPNHYQDSVRLYFLGDFTGDVWNAGDVTEGELRFKAPLKIGSEGIVTEPPADEQDEGCAK